MLTNGCVPDEVEVVFVKSVSSVAVYTCDCLLVDIKSSSAAALLCSCSSSDMIQSLLLSNSVLGGI